MANSFITVDGISLAYAVQNQDGGKVIFFIHGNSSSSRIWREQFDAEALSDYCLIAFDLPAQGQSAVAPDYSLPALGRFLAMAVAGLADDREFILAGLSLGVNITAEMLAHPLQPKGVVLLSSCALGGSYTMEVVFKPDADMRPSLADDVTEEELRQYWLHSCLCMHDENDEKYRSFAKDYFATTDNFRSKMAATVLGGNISEEVTLLRQTNVPMLVLFGEEEKTCNIDYLDNAGLILWQNKVHIIPEAGHLINIDVPETVNQLMAEFAAAIF